MSLAIGSFPCQKIKVGLYMVILYRGVKIHIEEYA
jgi:hypothetical protein